MFDKILHTAPTLPPVDELQRYLTLDVENVTDGLLWWKEKRTVFPRLSHMACGYLSIPGECLVVLHLPGAEINVP